MTPRTGLFVGLGVFLAASYQIINNAVSLAERVAPSSQALAHRIGEQHRKDYEVGVLLNSGSVIVGGIAAVLAIIGLVFWIREARAAKRNDAGRVFE